MNDICINLPAPVPSNTVYNDIGNNGTRGATRGVSSPINFSQSFNSQDNGCFHGDTNIIMSDYTIKKIKDIKGDKLLDKDNEMKYTVVCLIKFYVKFFEIFLLK